MGIIMMIIAIFVGQWLGSFLIGYLGSLGSGIVGTFLIGLVCYFIYTLLVKGKFKLMGAVVFAVLVWLAGFVAQYVDSMLGLGGGIFLTVITGVIASLLWGWVGGKFGGKKR